MVMPAVKHSDGLAYYCYGKGRPVLLIHGVGLCAASWHKQIDHLVRTNKVFVVDLPGHGDSKPLEKTKPTISDFSVVISAFIDNVISEKTIVIGHSLGALIALDLGCHHQEQCSGLVAISPTFQRDDAAIEAVRARADALASGDTENVSTAPINRWFTESDISRAPDDVLQCANWLKDAHGKGYAAAYHAFAYAADRKPEDLASFGRAALFVTGELDQNSTPDMSMALANLTPASSCAVIPDARHMLQLTHATNINEIIGQFVRTAWSPDASNTDAPIFTTSQLRNAFGAYLTGVTVVTTRTSDGSPVGFTANSFSSVSLDPPLLLVCPGKALGSFEVFSTCDYFAVNILAEEQQEIANTFATSGTDRFADIDCYSDRFGSPLLNGASVHFSCRTDKVIDAGDHIILLGKVDKLQDFQKPGLGYSSDGYFSLGLERLAAEKTSPARKVTIGAIIEYRGRVMLETIGAKQSLPQLTNADGQASLGALGKHLKQVGLEIQFGSVYSIFTDPQRDEDYIFYRARAGNESTTSSGSYMASTDINTLDFSYEPVKTMLQRYLREQQTGVFNLYVGDDQTGDVHLVGDQS